MEASENLRTPSVSSSRSKELTVYCSGSGNTTITGELAQMLHRN